MFGVQDWVVGIGLRTLGLFVWMRVSVGKAMKLGHWIRHGCGNWRCWGAPFRRFAE